MNKDEKHVHNILKDVPIFWINLERSERRRNIMQTRLDKYNLNHKRIEAVDGNKIDLEEYKKKFTINEKLNKYEVACALSHMKVIKYCYDQGLEQVLILEDDANFDYFPYKTDTILELSKELKTIGGECLQLANIINRKLFSKCDFKNNKYINSSVAGAQSYLLTKQGMKKIIDNFENNRKIEVAEPMIYNNVKNYLTAPYFSYPFLTNDDGEIINLSTIRNNTESAHKMQTSSKMLWDKYYGR